MQTFIRMADILDLQPTEIELGQKVLLEVSPSHNLKVTLSTETLTITFDPNLNPQHTFASNSGAPSRGPNPCRSVTDPLLLQRHGQFTGH